MQRKILLLFACISLIGAARPSFAADEYAAASVNEEGGIFFAWANTEAGAQEQAVSAYQRVSKTCNRDPGVTNELNDVFAYMCCRSPNYSCAASPHETKSKAEEVVRSVLSDFTRCSIVGYYSARTGRKE